MCGMKTGLGSHSRPVKMLAPKSLTGQMKYLERMSTLVMAKPNKTVKIHAPTNPAKVSLDIRLKDAAMLLTFDGLLRTNLNKLRAAESDTTDVCEYVVGDDKTDWQEEPDHALEDVVHDEVRLHNDQVKSHVGPGELSELELVVALLERANEEHEAWEILVKLDSWP